MSQSHRLPAGGRIDRARPYAFTFNGKAYQGYAGDTLASALLANGVKVVARSFKYHRPRGIFTAGAEEPNALVQLAPGPYTDANTRATVAELYDGLDAGSQNCWPSVDFDVNAWTGMLGRLFPAGFYYKTFMWPPKLWMFYERIIRNAAGMGKIPPALDPDRYEQRYTHCDVLVVGGGPAGIAAALAAGRTGARVILADEQAEWGGALLAGAPDIGGKPALDWVADSLAELAAMPEVTVAGRTTVTGYFDYNYLTALERVTDHLGPGAGGDRPRQRFWKIRAKQVVLATGSIERPLIFPDNDRPGIMLASAVRTYINRYGVLPACQLVVFTNNDSAYRTAMDAHAAGSKVFVCDARRAPNGLLVQAARELGVTIYDNTVVTGTRGKKALQGVQVRELNDDASGVGAETWTIDCDGLAVSGGWNPTVHLHSQSRGKMRFDDNLAAFVPATGVAINPNRSAGACNGTMYATDCLIEGAKAGAEAAKAAGFGDGAAPVMPESAGLKEDPLLALWAVPTPKTSGKGGKAFHELQNDSTVADIHLAAREGYGAVEHLKRYTTTGMGTDQGKTSNVNALAVMADIRGTTIPEVGTTTFRAPYTPVTFGAIGGRNVKEGFEQARPTPMHPWHVANGVVFEDVGDWKRPWYYLEDGEDMHAAVMRECKVVRASVGVLDASTLGKIDIQGPDAAEFLNRIYTNAWTKLGVGKARYGLMLNEQGFIFDDGVTTRLGDNHFHMTTTTGGAARVMGWLEEWLQTEWPEMRVYCTSVTEQWAVASISGPRARDLMAELTDIDLDPQTFTHMSMREGDVAGVKARLYRISFTGEMGFEINVPAAYGLHLWETIMALGAKYDICPYGTEAMHVLRAEKGYIIVGQDTDGTITPMDAGMDWIVSKKKGDFIGRRSFARADTSRPGRKQLVGLLAENPAFVIPEGAHLVEELKPKPPMKTVGHVTSSYMSPSLDRSIALALVEGGLDRMGDTVTIALHGGGGCRAVVTDPVFLDKKGERLNG